MLIPQVCFISTCPPVPIHLHTPQFSFCNWKRGGNKKGKKNAIRLEIFVFYIENYKALINTSKIYKLFFCTGFSLRQHYCLLKNKFLATYCLIILQYPLKYINFFLGWKKKYLSLSKIFWKTSTWYPNIICN